MALNVKCPACGADVSYAPGTEHLSCQYCKHAIEIAQSNTDTQASQELALDDYLEQFETAAPKIERHVVDCSGCGATTELDAKQQSSFCPFCDTPLVVEQAHTEALIKPAGLLPFKIDKKTAANHFKTWVSSLWFAPNELTQYVAKRDKFKGVYLPFWTYDCETSSHYRGKRGEYYYVDVTEKDSEGNERTRRERNTSWSNVSGRVSRDFDDVLVPASNSLPEKKLVELEPWGLSELVDYKDEFMSGYLCESYDVDLKTGYQKAKVIIDEAIRLRIKSDIGGDEQRISSVNTRYENATFKHILLPVWVSAYRYRNKVYQVLINARTGEVQAQRPWSIVKIAAVVLAALGVIAAGVFMFNYFGSTA